jgi:hypothetical protein
MEQKTNIDYTIGYQVKNILHDGKVYSPDDVNFEHHIIPGRSFVVYGKINDNFIGRARTTLKVRLGMYRFYRSFDRSFLYSLRKALTHRV